MKEERLSGLHQFALLLCNATVASRLAKAAAETPKAVPEGWRAAAQAIAKAQEAADGQTVHIPLQAGMHSRRGYGSSSGLDAHLNFDLHPLAVGAKHFDAFEKALEGLDKGWIEAAAKEIARSLAVGFERDGMAHLAYPQQGNGLRVKAKKSGIEVFGWKSDWRERVKSALPHAHVFNNTHGRYRNFDELEAKLTPEEFEALSSIKAYWEKFPYQAGYSNAALGDWVASGVHAAGRMPGSSQSEEELPKLAEPTFGGKTNGPLSDHYEAMGVMLGDKDKGTPAMRRLGWLAVALALGDEIDEAQAASGHAAPAARAEVALAMEIGAGESNRNRNYGYGNDATAQAQFPGARRAKRPALGLMQIATTLAADLANASRYNGASAGQFKEASHFSGSAEALHATAKRAKQIVKATDAAAEKVMKRARALAAEAESQWLEKNGLKAALEDAKLLSGSGPVSAKAVNWALANPGAAEGLRRAKENPTLGFASKSARYLGVIASGDEQTIERAKAAWAEKGLGEAGFEGAAKSEASAKLLADLWQAELSEKKKPVKEYAREKLELGARALQAAFESGADGKDAEAFASWCLAPTRIGMFLKGPSEVDEVAGALDRIHPDMPARKVGGVAESAKLLEQAAGRRAAHGKVMAAIYRAWGLGEGMPEQTAAADDKRKAKAAEWVGLFAKGEKFAPSIDWSKDLGEVWLVDLAHRTTGPMAKALREAAASGRHGQLAARAAAGLGIVEASDGNDLVARTRAKLRDDFGMSDSGWKALGKCGDEFFERLAREFEARAPEALTGRAAFELARKGAEGKSASSVGLGLSMLSFAAQYGVALEDVEAVEKMGRPKRTGESSELLRHGVRPIEASGEESARFAAAEAQAKADRMPRIVKTLCERIARAAEQTRKERGCSAEEARAAALIQVKDEVDLIDDWLRQTEDGVWQTLPEKAQYSDLMRRQQVWHEDMAAKVAAGEVDDKKAKMWPSPLVKHSNGEWSAALLACAEDLTEEGRAMKHCVSSYSGYCKAGASRIFSVRLNGERHSTLEFKLCDADGKHKNYEHQHPRETDRWTASQNRGKCNAAIKDPSALAFCEEIGEKINAAHLAWCKDLAAKRSEIAKAAAAKRKGPGISIG